MLFVDSPIKPISEHIPDQFPLGKAQRLDREAYESPALPLSYTAKSAPPAHVWGLLVAGGGFEPPTSGLCLPLQLSLPGEPVCSLDFPFTLGMTR